MPKQFHLCTYELGSIVSQVYQFTNEETEAQKEKYWGRELEKIAIQAEKITSAKILGWKHAV